MYTQAQLDLLKSNYAKGILSANLNGEMITFRSQQDLKATIIDIERALHPTTARSIVLTPVETSRGL